VTNKNIRVGQSSPVSPIFDPLLVSLLAGVLGQIAGTGAQTGSQQELKMGNFENPSSKVFQNGANMRTQQILA